MQRTFIGEQTVKPYQSRFFTLMLVPNCASFRLHIIYDPHNDGCKLLRLWVQQSYLERCPNHVKSDCLIFRVARVFTKKIAKKSLVDEIWSMIKTTTTYCANPRLHPMCSIWIISGNTLTRHAVMRFVCDYKNKKQDLVSTSNNINTHAWNVNHESCRFYNKKTVRQINDKDKMGYWLSFISFSWQFVTFLLKRWQTKLSLLRMLRMHFSCDAWSYTLSRSVCLPLCLKYATQVQRVQTVLNNDGLETA